MTPFWLLRDFRAKGGGVQELTIDKRLPVKVTIAFQAPLRLGGLRIGPVTASQFLPPVHFAQIIRGEEEVTVTDQS